MKYYVNIFQDKNNFICTEPITLTQANKQITQYAQEHPNAVLAITLTPAIPYEEAYNQKGGDK